MDIVDVLFIFKNKITYDDLDKTFQIGKLIKLKN